MQYSDLIEAARAARANAYAPYSQFAVGAALQTKSGAIFSGCNMENLSFGLTLCAERSAVAAATLVFPTPPFPVYTMIRVALVIDRA